MGPKKRKNPRNDFYFFMMDMKVEFEREGIHYNGMPGLANLCGPKWVELEDSEKEKYKEMARKAKSRPVDLKKFTSDGTCLETVQREAQMTEQMMADMVIYIKEVVATAHREGDLHAKRFMFIHIQSLVELADGSHLPCEIGLVEYSIESGICKFFHSFVLPPNIPMGYAYNIQNNARNGHNLDPDSEPLSCKESGDIPYVVDALSDFFNANDCGEPIPPLYTLKEDIEKTSKMLRLLYDWASCEMPATIKVYSIQDLFGAIGKETNCLELPTSYQQHESYASVAGTELSKGEYEMSYGMACEFHDHHEKAAYCSLGIARAWAYLISSKCLPQDKLEEGHHRPLDNQPGLGINPIVYEAQFLLSTWRRPESSYYDNSHLQEVKSKSDPAGVEAKNGLGVHEAPIWKQSEHCWSRKVGPTFNESFVNDGKKFPSLGKSEPWAPAAAAGAWGTGKGISEGKVEDHVPSDNDFPSLADPAKKTLGSKPINHRRTKLAGTWHKK